MMTTIHAYLSPDASGAVPMDPATAGNEPMGGGCRAGFHGLVKALSRRGGYDITAVSTYRQRRTHLDGVTYLRQDEARALPAPDVALAYYDTRPLIGLDAGLRIASHHTLIPHHSWDWNDVNTAPCQWAANFLKRGYDPHGRWAVLPNAVEGVDGVAWQPVEGRIIYHTSPDRGLHRLLWIWPLIRAAVPHATLHVVGNVRACIAAPYPPRSVRAQRSRLLGENLAKAEAAGGVTLLGRLPRADLLREISEAACFAFPASVSAPCETWSTSILECMAIGVPVVLDPVDALGPLWWDSVSVADQRYGTSPVRACEERMRDLHVRDLVVQALTDSESARTISDRQKTHAAHFTFDSAAEAFDKIVQDVGVAPTEKGAA